LQYIHENPDGDLSLDALADVALMSRFHWHRVFHAMTGETCAQAVKRIRLYRASTWLLGTDKTVADIASAVGYPNIQSFTRAFSETFGEPPATFRKNGKYGVPPKRKSKGAFTMFEVKTDTMPERRLAALLHTGPYEELGKSYEQLIQTATAENLWSRTAGMVGVHYSDPNVVSKSELRAHAGLVITDLDPVPEGLEDVTLPAGPCAVLHYKGPYTAIKVAYDYLYGDWLPKSGKEPADLPPYEIYLNDPAETEESELLTNIVVPLQA
jgi:AraC family transcriptional regulator